VDVRRVFIVGPPRVGTTLLSFLLAGSEKVLSLSEPYHAHRIMAPWAQHRFFCRLQKKAGLRCVRPPRRTDARRLSSFVHTMAACNGLPFLVVKETFHDWRLPAPWCNFRLLDGFAADGHPVIAMIRHPYDTGASTLRLLRRLVFGPGGWLFRRLLNNTPRFADDTHIVEWTARNYVHFCDWVQQRDLFLARYEDLVNQPEQQLRRICRFSGVPFSERLLDHRQRRTAFGGIGAPDVLYGRPRPISRKPANRSIDLSDHHRRILRDICGDCATVFGYALRRGRTTPS